MKIAVTGASGYLGKALINQAQLEGHDVVGLSRSKQNDSETFRSVAVDLAQDPIPTNELASCDVLVHLAAIMHGEREQQITGTLALTKNTLDCAYRDGIRHFVLISSMSVLDYSNARITLDDKSALASNEDDLGDYACTKAKQERLYLDWLARHECTAIILRPGLIYDDDTLPDAHAGFIKSKVGLYVKHEGLVPLAHLNLTVNAILAACKQRTLQSNACINVLDHNLPQQTAYISALKKQGAIKFGIPISEHGYRAIAKLARKLCSLIGKRAPDAFRNASVNARYSEREFKLSGLLALVEATNADAPTDKQVTQL
jgi:nucleoside-diphosphate-sugar epimerase